MAGLRRSWGPFVSVRLAAVAAAAALGAFGISWAARWPPGLVLLGLNGALILVMLSDVVRAPDPRALPVRREVEERARKGTQVSVGLRIRNPGPRPLALGVRDATLPSMARSPLRHDVSIPPGESVLEGTLVPARRGKFILGPITLRASGPLGLAGRQATLPILSAMKVYPELPGRAEVELRLDRARLLQAGDRSSAVRGGGGAFDSLREYHPDDEFRRINWRATARAAKPITNIFREERHQQVILLMDAGRTMATSVGGVSRFEHAIDAAMAVAELAARVGDQLGMSAFSARSLARLAPREGRSQASRVFDALFSLEPELRASDYAAAFSAMLGHHRRALLVLLTELAESSSMEPVFAALPAIAKRHLLIVGSVLDPALQEMAAMLPESSEQAYRKAAAAQAIAQRQATASRLAGMGAKVVDLPPGKLAGRLADEYLNIKALGRL